MVYIHFDIYLNQQFHSFQCYRYILREYKNVHDQILRFLHYHRDLRYVHNEMLMISMEKSKKCGCFCWNEFNELFHLLRVSVKHFDLFVPFQRFQLKLVVLLRNKPIFRTNISNFSYVEFRLLFQLHLVLN
jgi:hypothetical protein